MRRAAEDGGFTLVEMLVALILTVAVFGAVLSTVEVFQRQASANERRGDAQDHARNAVDQIAWLLRDAVSSTSASPAAVERSGAYDLIFLADDPLNPGSRQHVRYCIDTTGANERLLQQTAPSASALPSAACPDTAWSTTTRVLAGDLVNRLDAAAPTPAWTYDVRSGTTVAVGIDLMVDADPNQPPAATRLTSRVSLRNVNQPPVPVVSCQAAANRHAVCDASGSRDPDGQQLSFAWGFSVPPATTTSPLPGTSYHLDQVMTPGTYTFTVTVTDPAGSSSSATSGSITIT